MLSQGHSLSRCLLHERNMAALNRKLLLLQNLRVLLFCCQYLRRKAIQQQKCANRKWIRTLFKERSQRGLHNVLVKDLRLFDNEYFEKSFRIQPTKFEELLSWIAPFIAKSLKIRDVTTKTYASPCGT